MRENTKVFFKNSLISLLGFLAADALMAFVLFSPVFAYNLRAVQLAAGTVMLLGCTGAAFIGFSFLHPFKRLWQTVLSVTVVPILILLAATGLSVAIFQSEYAVFPLVIPGNLFFALLPEESGFWQNDITPPLCVCLAPLLLFLCMAVGTAAGKAYTHSEDM